MTFVTTSGASTPMERQTKGTFDRCINHKVTLPKLNDESSMNDQWIWVLREHPEEQDQQKSLEWFLRGVVQNKPNVG